MLWKYYLLNFIRIKMSKYWKKKNELKENELMND